MFSVLRDTVGWVTDSMVATIDIICSVLVSSGHYEESLVTVVPGGPKKRNPF